MIQFKMKGDVLYDSKNSRIGFIRRDAVYDHRNNRLALSEKTRFMAGTTPGWPLFGATRYTTATTDPLRIWTIFAKRSRIPRVDCPW